MDFSTQKEYAKHVAHLYLNGIKWIIFGILSGILVGFVAAEFANGVTFVTELRREHPLLLCLLPLAGAVIVFYYQLLGVPQPKGTNLVIDAIHEGNRVPLRMTPLIILSSLISHLAGASVGREGAALQIGGSMGNAVGRLVHMNPDDRRIIIMCGMSASFSALFGTPLAAAVFSMEISTVGLMYYSSLVPCVISALTAHWLASFLVTDAEDLAIQEISGFSVRTALIAIVFAVLCSLVSILFSVAVHRAKHLFAEFLRNRYLRAVVSGATILLLSLLVGNQNYNGTGMSVIKSCVQDPGFRLFLGAFLLKIIFTAISLAGGFQGGEIVPSLFIGATFGHAFAVLFGLDPALFSAIGMACIFCGVTNCPIASLLISCELFGFNASTYFFMAVAVSYLFSGNYGIYSAQKIMYSKIAARRVDTNAH